MITAPPFVFTISTGMVSAGIGQIASQTAIAGEIASISTTLSFLKRDSGELATRIAKAAAGAVQK